MFIKKLLIGLFALILVGGATIGCNSINDGNRKLEEVPGTGKKVIRLGYFPNITHSQALVGLARGEFKKTLGKDVTIETKIFNAGPAEIEALFADEIDIGYIGPNPAINGFIVSNGEALKIIAGATSGGAALVARKDAKIKKAKDLAGKKIASPQLGNTQDIALRFYLKDNDLKLRENGGNVEVFPTENPDIIALFQKKELDAAWVPEPWVSRLVKQANGKIVLDERNLWPRGEFVTANVIVSANFLNENPELVKKWLEGHVQTTNWINENKPEAQSLVNQEIKKITGKSLPQDVLSEAFSRLKATWDPVKDSLYKSANNAFELHLLKDTEVKDIYELGPLNDVLDKKGLRKVE